MEFSDEKQKELTKEMCQKRGNMLLSINIYTDIFGNSTKLTKQKNS